MRRVLEVGGEIQYKQNCGDARGGRVIITGCSDAYADHIKKQLNEVKIKYMYGNRREVLYKKRHDLR